MQSTQGKAFVSGLPLRRLAHTSSRRKLVDVSHSRARDWFLKFFLLPPQLFKQASAHVQRTHTATFFVCCAEVHAGSASFLSQPRRLLPAFRPARTRRLSTPRTTRECRNGMERLRVGRGIARKFASGECRSSSRYLSRWLPGSLPDSPDPLAE